MQIITTGVGREQVVVRVERIFDVEKPNYKQLENCY